MLSVNPGQVVMIQSETKTSERMKKRISAIIFAAFLFLVTGVCAGQEVDKHPFDAIISLGIEETTAIATRTRLNVDDVPAFVSILYHDELIKLGITDVYEALCLVPGVEPYMDASGARLLIFRGVMEKGKVKLLIDGIDINNTFRGSIYYYYDFPVELIQRD